MGGPAGDSITALTDRREKGGITTVFGRRSRCDFMEVEEAEMGRLGWFIMFVGWR